MTSHGSSDQACAVRRVPRLPRDLPGPLHQAGDAEAFRTVGLLIDEMACEYRQYWPDEDFTPRAELRAALADLRYLEGYLGRYLGSAYPFAAEIAERVREVADRLDRGLRNRRRFE